MEKSKIEDIKLVGFDVDGVLTDGRVILHDDGSESKHFHSRDGLGLKILMKAGFEVVIITGRTSPLMAIRAQELGISELHQKVSNKKAVFAEILKKRGLSWSEAAFAGDDLIDLALMRQVGLSLAPADATSEILAIAHFVSPAKGGRGAVRQMVEFILKSQGRWADIVKDYEA
ncbi:MAG: KdsC family phosphatase [Candidatus Adiutrix sp.]